MTRYRYRTDALLGPWRNSPQEAIHDAIRAQQATCEGGEDELSRLNWLVPGCIEADGADEDVELTSLWDEVADIEESP